MAKMFELQDLFTALGGTHEEFVEWSDNKDFTRDQMWAFLLSAVRGDYLVEGVYPDGSDVLAQILRRKNKSLSLPVTTKPPDNELSPTLKRVIRELQEIEAANG